MKGFAGPGSLWALVERYMRKGDGSNRPFDLNACIRNDTKRTMIVVSYAKYIPFDHCIMVAPESICCYRIKTGHPVSLCLDNLLWRGSQMTCNVCDVVSADIRITINEPLVALGPTSSSQVHMWRPHTCKFKPSQLRPRTCHLDSSTLTIIIIIISMAYLLSLTVLERSSR